MSVENPTQAELQTNRLRQAVSLFTLILVGATWPLWNPAATIPDIPWLSFLVDVQPLIDWLLLTLLVATCVLGLIPSLIPRRLRLQRCCYLIALGGLILLDQNRFQAWAWEFLLLTGICLTLTSREAVRTARWLLCGIYFYSAVTKFDHGFLTQIAPEMIEALIPFKPSPLATWPHFLVWLLPLGELAVFLLVVNPRTRRWGLRSSYVMHGMLIYLLGPLRLQHEWGVVLWNTYFLVQNTILLADDKPTSPDAVPASAIPTTKLAAALSAVLMLYPALGWFGYCDPWPAWIVYSRRPVRVIPLVQVEHIQESPDTVQPYVGSPDALSDWAPVNLDAVSFANLHAPLSPAPHYRAALWMSLSSELNAKDVGMDIHLPSSRFTGEHEVQQLRGREACSAWAGKRWANTKPRDTVP
ncbi:MAG: hypothetical protein H6824_18020 [Planctomycetaceae bacterium]|nr:hypothetical protein [Planctomycetaceae bacterium]